MSYYAQENYSEKVGNGPFTLKQIGCFVTAFSNLLERLDNKDVAPNILNVYFTEHTTYLPDPADGSGVKDDLAWGSVTAYDSTITVKATGSGSWPNSDNAIVEFHFEENGQPMTHFCLVDSVAKKTIVDSYDGVVKEPGIYGAPVAWATYAKNEPQVVTTPHTSTIKKTEPTEESLPTGWKLITVELGWGLERVAAAAGRSDARLPECWQTIAEANGSNDWQVFNKDLKSGQKVKVPPEGGKGEGDDSESMAQHPLAADKETADFLMDTSGAGTYTSQIPYEVTNLQDFSAEPKPLPAGQPVAIAGSFTVNGETYYRPQFAVSEDSWYGIPPIVFAKPSRQKVGLYGHVLQVVGTVVGIVSRRKFKRAH